MLRVDVSRAPAACALSQSLRATARLVHRSAWQSQSSVPGVLVRFSTCPTTDPSPSSRPGTCHPARVSPPIGTAPPDAERGLNAEARLAAGFVGEAGSRPQRIDTRAQCTPGGAEGAGLEPEPTRVGQQECQSAVPPRDLTLRRHQDRRSESGVETVRSRIGTQLTQKVRAITESSRTGLMSTTGVPSIASGGPTASSRLSIPSTVTSCGPSGFGRSDERVATTPVSGRDASSRGYDG